MNLYYTLTPKDVYGREVVPEDHSDFEIAGFRPPVPFDWYIPCVGGEPGEPEKLTAGAHIATPRLILRRKEKKYRYVTDGIERAPNAGDWIYTRCPNSFKQVPAADNGIYLKCLCFTREEVPE